MAMSMNTTKDTVYEDKIHVNGFLLIIESKDYSVPFMSNIRYFMWVWKHISDKS